MHQSRIYAQYKGITNHIAVLFTMILRIQSIPSNSLGFLIVSVHDRLEIFEVDVTKFVEPEVVESCRDEGKVILRETLIAVVNSTRESTKDPPIHRSFSTRELMVVGGDRRREGGRQKMVEG